MIITTKITLKKHWLPNIPVENSRKISFCSGCPTKLYSMKKWDVSSVHHADVLAGNEFSSEIMK